MKMRTVRRVQKKLSWILHSTQLRILQALDSDDDRISNPAIARWLLGRLDRRIAEADETTRTAYFPLADRISNAIRNLSQGDTPGNTADLRGTLRQFCILRPRELSPTNSSTPNQIGEEITQNYNNEFRNTHGDEAEENENTNQPEAEAEPLPEGEEGVRVPAHLYFEDNNPVYGPLTQVDSQIQEIQDRQAENLAILTDRYENAYINGDQEEMWAIQDQIDWWKNVYTLAETFCLYLHCNVLMNGFVSHNPMLFTAICNYVFIDECFHSHSE